MKIKQFVVEGLGHQSYFITDDASGTAAIVDPRRDIDVYLEAAQRTGTRITHVLETHIHNDYITGARELEARTEATIVAGRRDPLNYEYQPVREGDRFNVGQLAFKVMDTPGHTPGHVSYLVYEPRSEAPGALFSGGSLLAANAGRTDLLGEDMILTLTRQQYHSLRRLLDYLPGQLRVYPTHGAGSFCMSTGANSARTTTIAQERLVNPAALAKDEAEFVERQIAGYTAYPTYYRYMGGINQGGPRILGRIPDPSALTPVSVQTGLHSGIPLIDGRDRDAFARKHIPGAINIELGNSFATYAGWVLPFNVRLMLLIEDEAGRREAVVQLIRIGYERVEGYLDGGMESWQAAALPTGQFDSIDVETLHRRWAQHEPFVVLDVRRPDEWKSGHIPGAQHIHLGELAPRLHELPEDQPIATICASGFRAEIAASMVAASGREVIAVRGGVSDWIKANFPSTTSSESGSASDHDHTHAHP